MMTDAGARTKDYHAKLVYYLYPGVYERFQTLVGLHYGLAGNAKVKIQVFTDSKKVFSSIFGEKYPARKIDIPIKGTKKLTLFAGSLNCLSDPSFVGNKSIIWANPILK